MQTKLFSISDQPYITVASTPSSPVIEGRQLTLTCDVDSNPDTSGTWSRPGGQPLPGTTQTNGDLVITSVSRHDNGTYRCTATNSQKTNMLDTDITVHYPPDQMTITYNNITYDDDAAPRQLRCSPDGNPRSFTFLKWQHISVYGQFIRELNGETIGQESVLTIPDPGLDTSYQDTGYYVCRVENGVPDRNNQLVFSRREFFNVKAPPVYGIKTSVFRGQKETSINIPIPFYSTSGHSKVELSRNQSVVSNRFDLNTVPTNVSLTFHGTNITVGGFTTDISVQTLQRGDFGNYTLQVSNDVGVQQFEFYLKAAGPPDAPTDVKIIERAVNSISVEWIAGFDGGFPQQFIVEYATGESDWIQLPPIPHSTTIAYAMIANLNGNKFYRIRLSAINSFGSSSFVFTNTSTISITIEEPADIGAILGGTFGVLSVIFIMTVVLVAVRRRMAVSKKASVLEMQEGRNENQYDQINRNEREPPTTYEQINYALTAEHSEDASPVDSAKQQRVYEELQERSDQNVYDDPNSAQTGTTFQTNPAKNPSYENVDPKHNPKYYENIDVIQTGTKDVHLYTNTFIGQTVSGPS